MLEVWDNGYGGIIEMVQQRQHNHIQEMPYMSEEELHGHK